MQPSLRICLLAEALGTAILLIFGTGAAVVEAQTHALGHGGVAAAFGLVVFVIIQSLGETSGSHVNPAVTVAFWAMGRFPGTRVLPYMLAQLAGAALGSFLVKLIAGPGSDLGATLPAYGPWQALGIETFLTFWLVLVIFRVTSGSKEAGMLAALAISATVALEALVAGPLTGASMNPARSLAPALLSGVWTDWWVYVVGPVAGALLAVAVDKGLQLRSAAGAMPPG
ncbi:aquaporin [Microvirga sp. STS02]|uniref:MIP/aquaporin family protein n=1 Tax=Hymenobacter negativus TaxID=2795026 RepID=UPI0018DDD53F|nr:MULTISPECIES: aquaporin [Bacteria]MBH8567994.1 aquaporin [Hymenobacter negativus]MBR7207730.1 aquaporin [Microvirga sp. STS02]